MCDKYCAAPLVRARAAFAAEVRRPIAFRSPLEEHIDPFIPAQSARS
jgi:hypothetical protein